MNLYIQVEAGQTINHPAFESNLLQAFGCIPSNWEPFIRIERPELGVYEVLESEQPTYQKINGVWRDVWSLRQMTAEEKTAKQQAVITAFNNREQSENWSTWSFDEVTCTMQPPIPRPDPDKTKTDQGIFTFWCGAENNWKDTPPHPQGDETYKFDFLMWVWVKVPV